MLANRNVSESKQKIASALHLSEDRWISFFSMYKQPIVYSAMAILVVILLTFFFLSRSESKELNYLKAETHFQQLIRSEWKDDIQFKQFQESLLRNPQLMIKYQAPLAQELTLQGKWDDAIRYANAALEQSIQFQAWPFVEFSQASLLIGQHKYKEALSISKNLMQTMTLLEGHTLLAAYNLLRIAMLQMEVGTPQEEWEAWKDYNNFMAKNKSNIGNRKDNFADLSMLQNNFREGDISINDYIKHRETILKGVLERL